MQPTLPAPLLSRLSDLLARHIGLHFPPERRADLERGIAAAARAFGMPDVPAFAQRLLAMPLGRREIDVLVGCLTVGETYFFREPRSYEAFERHILPALLRVREQSGRRLRIWSAGCCTGEEPYSIAMLLDRLIPDAGAWNVTLLATDINPAFLRRAAEGEYGEWSFRATPEWVRARYFSPLRNGRYRLDERIRRRVSFSCLNLADDAYPSLTGNTNAMDVIFCRNVLMYLTPAQAGAVVDKLARALVDGGWLIVSPAETSHVLFSRFATVELEGAILYRRDDGAKMPRHVRPVPPPPADAAPSPSRFEGPAGLPPSAALPEPALAAADAGKSISPEPERLDGLARESANQGRLDEAAEWCRQAIAADKLDPAHHYLLAAIRQEQGQAEDAAQSLLRALYLDPGFVLAHYALGNLRQSQGRQREAHRHFDNALAALRTHAPGAILPESDGLTAGRLLEIIESMRPGNATEAAGP